VAYNRPSQTSVVFDLETIPVNISQAHLKKAEDEYRPPSNYKDPEKIAKHKQEFIEGLAERHKFRVGGARVVAAGLGLITGNQVTNIEGMASDDPNKIMKFLVDYLAEINNYRLVGYNIMGFDLPILSHALNAADLSLNCPQGKWDPIDLMFHFKGYGMKDLAESYGIETLKDEEGRTLDGGAVQNLYELGQLETIEKYVKHDILMEGRLFIALSRVFKF